MVYILPSTFCLTFSLHDLKGTEINDFQGSVTIDEMKNEALFEEKEPSIPLHLGYSSRLQRFNTSRTSTKFRGTVMANIGKGASVGAIPRAIAVWRMSCCRP